MSALPLQAVDNFLLQYNLGQVLLFVYVLATLAAFVVKRSLKLVALQTMTFGLIFALVPSIDGPGHYLYLGIALLMAAPLVYVNAGR